MNIVQISSKTKKLHIPKRDEELCSRYHPTCDFTWKSPLRMP